MFDIQTILSTFATHTHTHVHTHTHTHSLTLTVEDHFNSNVQLRRTARVDVGVAKDLQKAEVERFKGEESVRRRELEAK